MSFYLIFCHITSAPCSIEDAPYDKAVALYRNIPKESTTSHEKWIKKIRLLPYTNLLTFRSFCNLPNITAAGAESVLQKLENTVIRYENAAMLNYFCLLPDANVVSAWRFLEELNETNFVVSQVLASLKMVDIPSAPLLFPIISKIKQLDEPGQWAAKALFEIDSISYSSLAKGLQLLISLMDYQNRAVERFCKIPGINESTAIKGITEIGKLSFANSWNGRSIFLDPTITPESALFWLTEYLALSTEKQNLSFSTLPETKKTALLVAYLNASEQLIWQINNLHNVTDNFGREIGISVLKKLSFAELRHLFKQLNGDAQNFYQQKMTQAIQSGNRSETIKILRLTTELARKKTAQNLTTSNIYILLAQGGDLYDSSFRDILVPILKNRIDSSFHSDLLTFLLTIDPANNSTSNFITNLGQKGKLTLFFPEEITKQKEIIDLVTNSAFHDENSLILFSATFTRILKIVKPEVRSHLINIMLQTITTTNSILTSQLQVILQHYIKRHQELVPSTDREKISTMIQERGRIDTKIFKQTPFTEWLTDNKLQSLSVFQGDDDGINSFFSFCRALIKKGYRPTLADDYNLYELSPQSQKELTTLLAVLGSHPKNSLNPLFRISVKMPIVIDWKKELHGVNISHSVFIYQDKTTQQKLLAQFLISDYEMFAQRGHSYWRHEQLLDPLEVLSKRGSLSNPEIWKKQRFLSIGSCGGIKIYRELSRLFHNRLDILATIGTGKATINNPYNIALFEIVAADRGNLSWNDVARKTAAIFSTNRGEEYLQPGSLPAILHKMMNMRKNKDGTH